MIFEKGHVLQTWLFIPVLPALRKLRKEECEFKATLTMVVARHSFSKKRKKERKTEEKKRKHERVR
jgi:hypothetical protein